MVKESFIIYTEWREYSHLLTPEDKAALYDAFFDYHAGKEAAVRSPMAQLVFTVARQQFDRNEKRREETRRRLVEAGKRSGEARREKAGGGAAGAADRNRTALERVKAG